MPLGLAVTCVRVMCMCVGRLVREGCPSRDHQESFMCGGGGGGRWFYIKRAYTLSVWIVEDMHFFSHP